MPLNSKRPSRSRTEQLKAQVRSAAETKRLNAVVDADLYRRIKLKSASEGRSISDITRDLWSEYLSKYSSE